MSKITIVIERAGDGTYSAYAENGISAWGMGDTPEAAKAEALEGLRLFVENNSPENIPAVLKGEYEIEYKFDTASLLAYYKGIFTNAGLERITGINQRQIQHYFSGVKKPRPQQREKIEAGLHKLAKELLAIEL